MAVIIASVIKILNIILTCVQPTNASTLYLAFLILHIYPIFHDTLLVFGIMHPASISLFLSLRCLFHFINGKVKAEGAPICNLNVLQTHTIILL